MKKMEFKDCYKIFFKLVVGIVLKKKKNNLQAPND